MSSHLAAQRSSDNHGSDLVGDWTVVNTYVWVDIPGTDLQIKLINDPATGATVRKKQLEPKTTHKIILGPYGAIPEGRWWRLYGTDIEVLWRSNYEIGEVDIRERTRTETT